MLAVPFPLRELAVVETGKRIVTHSEYLSLTEKEQSQVAVLLVQNTNGKAASFRTPLPLQELVQRRSLSTLIGGESSFVRVVVEVPQP